MQKSAHGMKNPARLVFYCSAFGPSMPQWPLKPLATQGAGCGLRASLFFNSFTLIFQDFNDLTGRNPLKNKKVIKVNLRGSHNGPPDRRTLEITGFRKFDCFCPSVSPLARLVFYCSAFGPSMPQWHLRLAIEGACCGLRVSRVINFLVSTCQCFRSRRARAKLGGRNL